jgi:hypothetical protein
MLLRGFLIIWAKPALQEQTKTSTSVDSFELRSELRDQPFLWFF